MKAVVIEKYGGVDVLEIKDAYACWPAQKTFCIRWPGKILFSHSCSDKYILGV